MIEQIKIYLAAVRFKQFIQLATSVREALAEKRWQLSQFAFSAKLCRFLALKPMPLLLEVQKGTIVLPEKS